MNADKLKAYALVTVQMAGIAAILLTGPPLAGAVFPLLIEIAGVGLGIWAVAAMGVGNTRVAPLVKKDARLVTRGPYALIRHPMYSAVLLTLWPLVVDQFSLLRLGPPSS